MCREQNYKEVQENVYEKILKSSHLWGRELAGRDCACEEVPVLYAVNALLPTWVVIWVCFPFNF